MNNYELHSRAHELSASHSGYNLARRLLALEEEFKEYRNSASAVPYWLADIASQLYQACGVYDMPDRVMDVLSDLQVGKRPKSVDILPVHPPQQAQGEAISWISEDGLRRVQKNDLCHADVASEKTRFRTVPLFLGPPAPAAVPEILKKLKCVIKQFDDGDIDDVDALGNLADLINKEL